MPTSIAWHGRHLRARYMKTKLLFLVLVSAIGFALWGCGSGGDDQGPSKEAIDKNLEGLPPVDPNAGDPMGAPTKGKGGG